MKTRVVLIFLLTTFLFECLAQKNTKSSLAMTLTTSDCIISCGQQLNYESKVTIKNDTIRIYMPQDDNKNIVGEYLILKSKEKWKTPEESGHARFRALFLQDSTKNKYTVTLNLKESQGTMNFYHAQFCELSLTVSSKGHPVSPSTIQRYHWLKGPKGDCMSCNQ